jgi:C4-type Zn-finger protein
MIDNEPTNESAAEKIHNEREVLNIFEEIIGGDYEITKSVEDEAGLSALEVIAVDETGEKVGYNYRRTDFQGETIIDVVFYDGDTPCGGYDLKEYKGGAWVEQK